jgi:N utilization substance protein A
VQIEAKLNQLINQAHSCEVTPTQLAELLPAAFRRAFAQSFHLPEETLTVCVKGNEVSVQHNGEELTSTVPDRALVTAVRRLVIQGLQEIRATELYRHLILHEGQLVEAVVSGSLDNNWITLRIEGQGEELRQLRTQLPHFEQLPGETYSPGQRLRVFLLKLDCFGRDGFLKPTGWRWLVSRAHPGLVRELFHLYLPDLEVLDVVRQAGILSKVAVGRLLPFQMLEPILAELPPQERVSLVQWSEVPEVYLANALSPARVYPRDVTLLNKGVAEVRICPDQMSRAYGRGWLNLKLAQRLTGYRIGLVAEAERTMCNV